MKAINVKSLILLISLFLTLGNTLAVKSSCNLSMKDLLKRKEAKLLEENEVVWGNYICDSCGTESSMKPSKYGDVRCGDDDQGCGIAHTGEADFPPAFFKRGGDVYIMNRTALVDYYTDGKYQGHGLRKDCPYCGSDHFANMGSCVSCGAEVSNLDDVLGDLPTARPSLQASTSSSAILTNTAPNRAVNIPVKDDAVSGEDLSRQTGITEEETVVRSSSPEIANEKIVQQIQLSRNQILAIGATGSVFVASGGAVGYHRAKETFVVTASVSEIEGDKVWFTYNFEDKNYRHSLRFDIGKAIEWRIGETFEVHLIRWKGAVGVERGNGEVYSVEN